MSCLSYINLLHSNKLVICYTNKWTVLCFLLNIWDIQYFVKYNCWNHFVAILCMVYLHFKLLPWCWCILQFEIWTTLTANIQVIIMNWDRIWIVRIPNYWSKIDWHWCILWKFLDKKNSWNIHIQMTKFWLDQFNSLKVM